MPTNIEWTDVTSHGQRDTDRTPRAWARFVGKLRIVVHRYADLPGWHVTCNAICIKCRGLAKDDIEDAKEEALRFIGRHLAQLSQDVAKITPAATAETDV